MKKQKQQNWFKYITSDMEKEPKNPMEMIGLALSTVIKTSIFIVMIWIKTIRRIIDIMPFRGKLRKNKQDKQPTPNQLNPEDITSLLQNYSQQPTQQNELVSATPIRTIPIEQYEQTPQQPIPQQPIPPAPQQPIQRMSETLYNMQQIQPQSAMQSLPMQQSKMNEINVEMLNQIYGAFQSIRQEFIQIQTIINQIHQSISGMYDRLNVIEGIQPIPQDRIKFQRKK